jgi:hypothetical protein
MYHFQTQTLLMETYTLQLSQPCGESSSASSLETVGSLWVADPFLEVDLAVGAVRRKVRRDVIDA